MKELFAKAQAIFSEALAIDEESREDFVKKAAGGNAKLQKIVNRLLHHHAADVQDHPSPQVFMEHLRTQPSQPAKIGAYEVIKTLGAGGMGVVFLAEQPKPKRLVAVKVINRLFASEFARKRFDEEAEHLGKLQHAGIAQIYESGHIDDSKESASFIAMEYVEGETVTRWAESNIQSQRAAVRLLIKIASAVHHAHLRGIVHRDLKPDNILVTQQGEPKILDFGIAQAIQEHPTFGDDIEVQKYVAGTPGYMSPEQELGNRYIGPESDVYALGSVGFEILYGEKPNPRGDSEGRERRGTKRAATDLRLILEKSTKQNPDERYQSVADFSDDLKRFLDNQPIAAREHTPSYLFTKFAKRNKILFAGAMTTTLALLIGIVVAISYARDEAEAAKRADAKSEESRQIAYAASMSVASVALHNNRIFEASQYLANAPSEHQGWEWNHLQSRLDDSHVSTWLSTTKDFERLLAGPVFNPSTEGFWTLHRENVNQSKLTSFPGLFVVSHFDSNGGLVKKLVIPNSELPINLKVLRFEQSPNGSIVVYSRHLPHVIFIDPHTLVITKVDSFRGDPPTNGAAIHTHEDLTWVWNEDEEFWNPAFTFTSYSKDQSLLAYRKRNKAFIWDRASSESLGQIAHSGIISVAISPDRSRIASISSDGSLKLWQIKVDTIELSYETQITREWLREVNFSPDGKLVVLGDDTGTVSVIKSDKGELVTEFFGHQDRIKKLDFSPNGKTIVSISRDGNIRLWNVFEDNRPDVLLGHTSYVYPVVYTPDGQRIISGAWDGTIRFWDARSGDLIATKSLDPNDARSRIVASIKISPDGTLVAYQSCRTMRGHKRVRILNAYSGEDIVDLGTFKPCEGIAFSPDGERLAITTDVEAIVFRTSSWTEELRVPSRDTICCFRNKDELLVGSPHDLHSVVLWDLATKSVSRTIRCEQSHLLAADFSPNGRYLAVAFRQRRMQVWDLQTNRRIIDQEKSNQVYDLSFSPDGKRLAGGAELGLLRIWETENWREVVSLFGHQKYIWSVDWRPDGLELVSGSGDSTVRLWGTTKLAERLRDRATRKQFIQKNRSRLKKLAQAENRFAIVEQINSWSPREKNLAKQILLQLHFD